MREEFDVNLTPQDMYKFNMYHTYHGMHGVLSIVMAIFVFVVAAVTWREVDTAYTVIYIILGLLFVFYMPLNLWIHAKMQMQKSEALRNTQHFIVDDTGITIVQGEEQATLEWNKIYKVVSTKSNLLVYSTRVNAYVFPRRDLGEHYEPICAMMREKLEKYRLKIK